MPDASNMENGIQAKLLEYLIATPKAMAVLVASFISGNLWAFIITAFIRSKRKGNSALLTVAGRTSLGFGWFMVVFVPFYIIKYHEIAFEYSKILQISIPTVIIGIFIQLVLFVLFLRFGDRK